MEYVHTADAPSAFYKQIDVVSPFDHFGLIADVGTGGVRTGAYYEQKNGYNFLLVKKRSDLPNSNNDVVQQITFIQQTFGRSMSRLTEVFGVSRQSLYNWKAGEQPKEKHLLKINQLVEAAKVFSENNFALSTQMLERKTSNGKSFIEHLREDGSGIDAAKSLIKSVVLTQKSKDKLAQLLGGRAKNNLEHPHADSPHLFE